MEGYARSGGRLGDGVLELAAGRHFNIQPYRRPLPPYPEAEWQRLTAVCRQQVDDSYATHRHALASVPGGRHPGAGGWSRQNFCWLLSTLGPIGSCEAAEAIGMSINIFRHRGVTAVFHEAAQAMFPHLEVVIAYRLLFGIYSGIVPDGIADLEIGDIDWAGDSTVLLSYIKRRTAAESPPCRAGGAVARAVAGALGAAAQLRATGRADHAVVGDEPARQFPPSPAR